MTARSPAPPVAPPTGTERWVGTLAGVLLALGVVAASFGVLYAVNGATQAGATVKVPVTLAGPEHASGWGDVQVEVAGLDPGDAWLAGAPPQGVTAGTVDGRLTLAAWGSTRTEQVLARGETLLLGLGLLGGALALRPVLRSVAAGRPFAPGNARRIAVVAGVVGVVGFLAPLLPQLAGLGVLDRTGLADSGAFHTGLSYSLEPLGAAALVLVVALAFRTGEQLARDTDGLV